MGVRVRPPVGPPSIADLLLGTGLLAALHAQEHRLSRSGGAQSFTTCSSAHALFGPRPAPYLPDASSTATSSIRVLGQKSDGHGCRASGTSHGEGYSSGDRVGQAVGLTSCGRAGGATRIEVEDRGSRWWRPRSGGEQASRQVAPGEGQSHPTGTRERRSGTSSPRLAGPAWQPETRGETRGGVPHQNGSQWVTIHHKQPARRKRRNPSSHGGIL